MPLTLCPYCGTKFVFKVTRGHGYEAGEYNVEILSPSIPNGETSHDT